MEGEPEERVLRGSVAHSLLSCPVDCIEAHDVPLRSNETEVRGDGRDTLALFGIEPISRDAR